MGLMSKYVQAQFFSYVIRLRVETKELAILPMTTLNSFVQRDRRISLSSIRPGIDRWSHLFEEFSQLLDGELFGHGLFHR